MPVKDHPHFAQLRKIRNVLTSSAQTCSAEKALPELQRAARCDPYLQKKVTNMCDSVVKKMQKYDVQIPQSVLDAASIHADGSLKAKPEKTI